MSTTQERLIRLLADQLGVDPLAIKSETSPVKDLAMDSLDEVETIMEVEDEFAIRIEDDEAAACSTVADWVAMVDRKVAEVTP